MSQATLEPEAKGKICNPIFISGFGKLFSTDFTALIFHRQGIQQCGWQGHGVDSCLNIPHGASYWLKQRCAHPQVRENGCFSESAPKQNNYSVSSNLGRRHVINLIISFEKKKKSDKPPLTSPKGNTLISEILTYGPKRRRNAVKMQAIQ